MKVIKCFLFGYLMGVGMTWLLYLILTLIIGTGSFSKNFNTVFSHCDEIFAQSLVVGGIMPLVWLFAFAISNRIREKRELEKAMTDYFRKKAEKEC